MTRRGRPRRQERKAQNQIGYHLANMQAADNERARLFRACLYLIAEAARHNRITEVLLTVLDLAFRLRQGKPLPEPVPGSDAHQLYAHINPNPDFRRDVA